MTNISGNSYSYFTDGNGNVVDLTDAYGNSAAHYEYDPFGNIVTTSVTLQQPNQWSSKETDASTGLVYYLYRYYNPSLERWLNRDPLGERGGLNLYSLLHNHPVKSIDPFGLDESDWEEGDCLHLSLRDGAELQIGLGLTIEVKAEIEGCTCCNTQTHEVKPTFKGKLKAGISAEAELGIGLGGGIFGMGIDFEADLKGPSINISVEGTYEKECDGEEQGLHFEASNSGFIGIETQTALEYSAGVTVGITYKLAIGVKDINSEGATAYASASVSKGFGIAIGLGGAEVGGDHPLVPDEEQEVHKRITW